MPLPRYPSQQSWEEPPRHHHHQQDYASRGPESWGTSANYTGANNNDPQGWYQRGRYETSYYPSDRLGYNSRPMQASAVPHPLAPPTFPESGWPPPLGPTGTTLPVAKPLPPDRSRGYQDLDAAPGDSGKGSNRKASAAAVAGGSRPYGSDVPQSKPQQPAQRICGLLTMIDASRGFIHSKATGLSKVVFHISQCSSVQQKQMLIDRFKRNASLAKDMPVAFSLARHPNGTCVAKSVTLYYVKPPAGQEQRPQATSAPSGTPTEVLERARKVQEAAVAAVASAKALYPTAKRGKGSGPKASGNRKKRRSSPPHPPAPRRGKSSSPKKGGGIMASPRGSAPVRRSFPPATAKASEAKSPGKAPPPSTQHLAPNDLANPNAPILGALAQLTVPPGFPPPPPPPSAMPPAASAKSPSKAKQQPSAPTSSPVVRDWRSKGASPKAEGNKDFSYKQSAEHPLRLVKAGIPPKVKSPAKIPPKAPQEPPKDAIEVEKPPATDKQEPEAPTPSSAPVTAEPKKPAAPTLPIDSRTEAEKEKSPTTGANRRSMSITSAAASSVSPISVATLVEDDRRGDIPEDDLDFTCDSDGFARGNVVFKEGWLPIDPPNVTVTLLGSTCEDVSRAIRRICAERSCVSLEVVDVPIERGYSTRSSVLAIGTRHGVTVLGCDGPTTGRASKSDNEEWTVARTVLANHLFGRASSRSSTVPLVVGTSNGASRLCRFLGMHDLSREETLQCVDIVDAIKKMLAQSEKGGGQGLPPHADVLIKDIRMFHDARSLPITLSSLCNFFHRPHRVLLGSTRHSNRAFDLGHVAFYTRRVFQQFNKLFTGKPTEARKRKRPAASAAAPAADPRVQSKQAGAKQPINGSAMPKTTGGVATIDGEGTGHNGAGGLCEADRRLVRDAVLSFIQRELQASKDLTTMASSSLASRHQSTDRFRVLPTADDAQLVHRKALWDARGCNLTLNESDLTDMSNDVLVDYLRILYFNDIDIYFLLGNSDRVQPNRPISYENPCNERKALFVAKKLLVAHGASSQRVAKLQAKIDTFCGPANGVHVSSTCEEIVPYISEVAPKCEVGKRPSNLGGGVGLYAKENVSAGDVVIRVPEGDLRIINIYEAAADPEFGPVVADLLAAGHHIDTCLLLYLVHVYKSAKLRSLPSIASFIQYLPEEFSGNLMEWPLEALDALGIPQIRRLVTQQMDLLWGIHRALPAGLCSSFDEELLWARSLCDSRAFALDVPPPTWCPQWLEKYLTPEQPITCVIPGADLLNHHQRGQCGFPRFDKDSRSFVITAEANVPAGSELFINYGGLQNWEQLMYYGFCEFSQNPYDSVTLDLAAPGAQDGLQLDTIGTEHVIRRGSPTVSPRLWEALTNMAGVEHPEELEEGAVDSLVALLRQVTLAPAPETSSANDWWMDDYGEVIAKFRSSQMALVDDAERVLREMVAKDKKARAVHSGGQAGYRRAKAFRKRR
ncbi:hypothetical protein FOL47_000554 [Perkinsus chesapeaki]|uniref:SET domain-containing protein n=1 Tax=Perkinsus chesapeaki TaxID=330153 RepID=A0A7J6N123_PERCH|nr:hypothetical protein FOL47_000554 [Perkinsus chesapeaki]